MDDADNEQDIPMPDLLARQRSHVLFVLSHPVEERETPYHSWFTGAFRDMMGGRPEVVDSEYFQQHEIDITGGRYAPVEYAYLALYGLSLDGGDQVEPLLREIAALHRRSGVANPPATWLYYPVSETVGRPGAQTDFITVAYANPVPGMEAQFREFYVTRHVRHALGISALVSGQCFERAQHQRAGSMQPYYRMIAVYGQATEPEAFLRAYAGLPPGTLDFPMLDKSRGRFSECSYRRLG